MGNVGFAVLYSSMQSILLLVLWNKAGMGSNRYNSCHGSGLVYQGYAGLFKISQWDMAGKESHSVGYFLEIINTTNKK